MFNQYIEGSFAPVAPQPPPPPAAGSSGGPFSGAAGQMSQRLRGLLGSFHLESIDTGDILLVLIILLLYLEGDDLEMVITLGLMLLFSLGRDGQDTG